MSERHVALLRGINLAAKSTRVAMADLRKMFEELGCSDVRTLLNSGNVVFTASVAAARKAASRVERMIAERCGVTTRVIVLHESEVAAALRDNPLRALAKEPARLLLVALEDAAAAERVKPLLKARWEPERLALAGNVAYVWCANSVSESRAWIAVNRAIGAGGTARNLATMTRLHALLTSAAPPRSDVKATTRRS